MESDLPVRLRPQKTLDQAPGAHIVVVRGRRPGTLAAMVNPATLEYVQAAAKSAHTVASVCTGALILASAGLKRDVTPHSLGVRLPAGRLGAWYLRKRWVEDGKFICSEGVSAGIDRALDLGAKLTNEELLARRSSCLFQVPFSHRIG